MASRNATQQQLLGPPGARWEGRSQRGCLSWGWLGTLPGAALLEALDCSVYLLAAPLRHQDLGDGLDDPCGSLPMWIFCDSVSSSPYQSCARAGICPFWHEGDATAELPPALLSLSISSFCPESACSPGFHLLRLSPSGKKAKAKPFLTQATKPKAGWVSMFPLLFPCSSPLQARSVALLRRQLPPCLPTAWRWRKDAIPSGSREGSLNPCLTPQSHQHLLR